jgi:plastocyanin
MRTIAVLVAALALALAGCGGSSNKNAGSNTSGATATPASNSGSSGSSSSGALALSAPADGSLKFDKTTLTAKAGKVTIDFDNPSSVQHGVEIEGNGVEEKSEIVTSSKTSVSADLKPGKYEYYCPVPGHKEAGMEGTLTVQ